MSIVNAKDIVIQTLPLFEMARMRSANTARCHPTYGFAGDGPASNLRWVNQFTHTRRLLGPQDREVVTPNNDTLYTNAWLDLSEGPLVISVPQMGDRYWTLGFLDAWTNPWAYAGKRTTGGAAQRLFIHGPGWEGQVPQGMHCISAAGDDVWIIGRILVDDDPQDLAAVHELQRQFSVQRLDGTDALSRIDVLLDGRRTGNPSADDYERVLHEMLRRNHPESPILGWPVAPEVLTDAINQVYTELRENLQGSDLGGGWHTAVTVRTHFGDNFLGRARVARNWIGTLGVEEAMYIMAEIDAKGEMLEGSRRYLLRFSPGHLPSVDAFWSITLYRRSDCLLVNNSLGRYSIGDRTRGLQLDADGGLSIRIQATDPGTGNNWLPAPANEAFYLTLRLYQPRADHLDNRFVYPALERVE